MRKTTLSVLLLFCAVLIGYSQHTFDTVDGPIEVAAGSPETIVINDVDNGAGAASFIYAEFTVTADWVNGSGAYSSEADLTIETAAGTVNIDPPSSGSEATENSVTITFTGALPGEYDPDVDGSLSIILNQSWGGSSASWSNISVTISPASDPPNCASNPTPADGATDVPVGEITLNWDAPTDGPAPTSYDLFAGVEPDFSDQGFVGNYETNTADVLVNGFDVTIYWQIVPVNGVVSAEGCPYWSFTTVSPPTGALCDDPLIVDSFPFNTSGTTNGFGNDYTGDDEICSNSGYLTGDDIVYAYTPSEDMTVNITLSNTDTWVGLFVYEGCNPFTVCVDSATSSSGNPFINELELTSGTTYYIVISTFPAPQSTEFTLDIAGPPDPIVPDFMADFSSYPDGWFEASGEFGSPTGDSSTWTSDDFGNDPSHPNGSAARVNIFGTTLDEYLISPVFDLSGGLYYLNFDIALVDWDTTDATSLGPDDYVSLVVTEDDGANWTELQRWDASSDIGATREAVTEIELDGYGSEVQFAFYAFSDTSNADTDFFMDNFSISTNSLSVSSVERDSFSYYPNPTNAVVFFESLSSVEKVTAYNMLGQVVLQVEPNTMAFEIDLSQLQNGTYFLEVSQSGYSETIRVIKN